MAKLRMGYVGCGFMAQKVHIPNILALEEECELAAIAEVRGELGERVRRRWNIPRLYVNHEELAADDSIDAVAVSANGTIQGQIAADLLKAGKHVFLEKPMAVSVPQAEGILQAEEESGKRLMIAYLKRYDAGNRLVKELMDQYRGSGEMGEVRYVRNHGFCGSWTGGLDTPMDKTKEPYPATEDEPWPEWLPEQHRRGYYGYLQQYTHNVNLLRWFLGAGSETNVKSVSLDSEGGVAGVVVLDMGGIRTVIESGNVKYHGWDEHTQIYFENGWIRTEAPPLLLRNVPASVEVYRGHEPAASRADLFPKDGYTWAYKEEMKHFIECLKTERPFESSGIDTLADVCLMEDIYRKHVENGC